MKNNQITKLSFKIFIRILPRIYKRIIDDIFMMVYIKEYRIFNSLLSYYVGIVHGILYKDNIYFIFVYNVILHPRR